jgi:hypothetical protein
MWKRNLTLFGLGCLALWLTACRSEWMGDLLPNQTPETYAVVDSIQRSGPERLPTSVQLHWWASDPDGVVDHYDFRVGLRPLNTQPWSWTRANDTLVRLNLPPGPDTADFELEIRAVDLQGLPDPTPARLLLPLRNTAPQVAFVYNPDGGSPLAGAFPLESCPVLGYRWAGTDSDGDSTILYYEICLNDTSSNDTVRISSTYTECILEWANNSGQCQIFVGPNDFPLFNRLGGLIENDTNRLYIRAIDQSLSASPWVASRPTKVKSCVASILLVNAYGNDPNPTLNVDTLSQCYKAWLDSLNVGPVEELRLFQKIGNRFTQLSVNNRVQSRIFARFGRILWIASDFDLAMQFSSRTLGGILSQGGDVMLAAKADASTPAWTPAYESSPIDSVTDIPSGFSFLVTDTSTMLPLSGHWNGQAWTLPTMTHQGYSSGNRPLKLGSTSLALYKINLLLRDNNNPAPPFPLYSGPSVCMGVKVNALTGSTYTLSSVELHRMLPSASMLQMLRLIKTRVWQWPTP